METYIPLDQLKKHRRKEKIKNVFRVAKGVTIKGIKASAKGVIKGTKATVRGVKKHGPVIAKNLEKGRKSVEKFGIAMSKYAPRSRRQSSPSKKKKSEVYDPFGFTRY